MAGMKASARVPWSSSARDRSAWCARLRSTGAASPSPCSSRSRRRSRTSARPRIHPPTLEMLDALGVSEKILPLGLVSTAYRFHDRVTDIGGRRFDLDRMRDEFRFPFVLQYEQYKLTASIAAEYANAGDFDVRFSHSVTGLTQSADGVDVEIATPDGTERTAGRLRDRLRRRAQHRAQARRHRVRGLHLSGALHQDRDQPSISARLNPNLAFRNYFSDPHEWCNLFKVRGEEPRRAVARDLSDPGRRERRTGAATRSGSRRVCRSSFPSPGATRSSTSTSMACTSAWPRPSARAACCSPATPPTSTTRSAAWA